MPFVNLFDSEWLTCGFRWAWGIDSPYQRSWIMPELNAKILIVYGDEIVRGSLTTLLEQEGFSVLQASDETTGLDMIRKGSPDLMLVDIKISDLNGMDILREARNLHPNLFIIAITAYRDIHGAAKALDAGADSCLEKPFPIQEVNKAVRQALLNKKLESQVKILQGEDYLPPREVAGVFINK